MSRDEVRDGKVYVRGMTNYFLSFDPFLAIKPQTIPPGGHVPQIKNCTSAVCSSIFLSLCDT